MGNIQNRFRHGGDGAGDEFAYHANGGGLYFGEHFVMGGEEFAALDPEAFLFGDMADLNELSNVPGSIRTPPNFAHVNTTQCLFFSHKDSLKLIQHVHNGSGAVGGDGVAAAAAAAPAPEPTSEYHLDFTFDANAPCAVTVHFFCEEVAQPDGTVQIKSKFSWPTRHFKPGLGLQYSHPESPINLADVPDEALFFNQGEGRTYPIIISTVSDEHGPHHALHTYGAFERNAGGALGVRQLVQKVSVNGLCLVLKEIFGIERETDDGEAASPGPDDLADDNTECVVCMSSPKDTMVLPCRHMCLCNPCAEVLRFQANKCPICRAPYHSLLQIRVLQPKVEGEEVEDDEDAEGNPPGFNSIALSMAVEPQPSLVEPEVAAEYAERAELGEVTATGLPRRQSNSELTSEGGVAAALVVAPAAAGPAEGGDQPVLPPLVGLAGPAAVDTQSGEYLTVDGANDETASGDSLAVGPSAVPDEALDAMLESTFRQDISDKVVDS